jgi:hypothetical protein
MNCTPQPLQASAVSGRLRGLLARSGAWAGTRRLSTRFYGAGRRQWEDGPRALERHRAASALPGPRHHGGLLRLALGDRGVLTDAHAHRQQ